MSPFARIESTNPRWATSRSVAASPSSAPQQLEQRRADLVAHHREELARGPAGGHGTMARVGQLFVAQLRLLCQVAREHLRRSVGCVQFAGPECEQAFGLLSSVAFVSDPAFEPSDLRKRLLELCS